MYTCKVKRPMNSFMVWAKGQRPIYKKKCPHFQNKDISSLLGEVWNNLSEHEKEASKIEAERIANWHKDQYPDWKYRPQKNLKVFQVQAKQVQAKQVQVKQVQAKQVHAKQVQAKQIQAKQIQAKKMRGRPSRKFSCPCPLVFTKNITSEEEEDFNCIDLNLNFTDTESDYTDTTPNTPEDVIQDNSCTDFSWQSDAYQHFNFNTDFVHTCDI